MQNKESREGHQQATGHDQSKWDGMLAAGMADNRLPWAQQTSALAFLWLVGRNLSPKKSLAAFGKSGMHFPEKTKAPSTRCKYRNGYHINIGFIQRYVIFVTK